MTRISPSPGQKIIYLLLILLGGFILYVDINTNNFKNIKNGFNSFKISSHFLIKSFSINPIIDFKNHFQYKDRLIKENNQLNIALEKSYVEKYVISQDSKFFKDTKFLEDAANQNSINKPYHIAQLKKLDPNIFNCCDKHRMHIQLLTESNESFIEGVVFNSAGIIGHIIHDKNYKEVILLTDTSHFLPIKNISEDFFCNARGSGTSDYVICNFNPLVLNKEIAIGQNFFTSGLGGIYPKDIKIGVVEDIRTIDSNNTELNIKLFSNPMHSNLFGVINF